MTKSTTRVAADLETFTQTEITAKDVVAKAGRKNLIINGGFDVSQRGDYTTAVTIAAAGYYIDRWKNNTFSVTGTTQHKKLQTVDGGITNTNRVEATSSATGYLYVYQRIEYFEYLGGQTLTFSAWVKSNSSDVGLITYNGSGEGWIKRALHSGSGGWEFLTATYVMDATLVGALNVGVSTFGDGGLASAIVTGDYFEVTNVQLELGSVATDFEHRSYGEELALCQRYYQVLSGREQSYAGNTFHKLTPIHLRPALRASPFTSVTYTGSSNLAGLTVYSADNQVINIKLQATTDGMCNTGVYTLTADAEL